MPIPFLFLIVEVGAADAGPGGHSSDHEGILEDNLSTRLHRLKTNKRQEQQQQSQVPEDCAITYTSSQPSVLNLNKLND